MRNITLLKDRHSSRCPDSMKHSPPTSFLLATYLYLYFICISIFHHISILDLQQLDESLSVEIPEGEIAQTPSAANRQNFLAFLKRYRAIISKLNPPTDPPATKQQPTCKALQSGSMQPRTHSSSPIFLPFCPAHQLQYYIGGSG